MRNGIIDKIEGFMNAGLGSVGFLIALILLRVDTMSKLARAD